MMKVLLEFKGKMTSLLAEDSLSLRMQRFILASVLVFCLLVRLMTIDAPALDRTAWKEIDYIVISSNYAKNGYNFFKPEITWPAEPPRTTAMELPLVPYLTSLLFPVMGFNAYSVRMLTLLSFLMMSFFLFRLTKREFGPIIGLLTAFASAIIPLYHPFGKLLFSEPLMIALCVVSIFYYNEWAYVDRKKYWLIAVCGFSLAVALKIEPLYLLFVFTYIAYRKYGLHFIIKPYYLGFVIGSIAIAAIWYPYSYYISRTSIDVFGTFGGMYGGHDKLQTLTMLGDLSWYETMFGRIRGIGGKIGIPLFLLGLLIYYSIRAKKLFLFYLIAVGVYFVIVAEGNIDAPYRQMNIIPVFSAFVALGAVGVSVAVFSAYSMISERSLMKSYRNVIAIMAFGLISLIIVQKSNSIFGCDPLKPVDSHRWLLAQKLRKYAKPGDKIITLGEYTIHKGGQDVSPVIYYYSGLQGWTLQRKDWKLEKIESLVQKGGKLLIATKMYREPESKWILRELLKKGGRIIFEDKAEQSVIYDLRQLKIGEDGK